MSQLIFEDFVGITANILILGAALGLMFSILNQPRRERANWWFAAFLLMLAAWSFSGIISSLPEIQAFIPARTSLYLYITSLGMVPVLYFMATMSFCGISTPFTRGATLFAIPGVVLAILLLWTDQTFLVDFTTLPVPVPFNQVIEAMAVTPAGYLTLVMGGLYPVFAYIYLRRTPGERSEALRLPTLLIIAGILGNAVPPLTRLPFDVTLSAIAAILIGHTMIRHQLFNPLSQLNDQLIEANQDLRLLVSDLTTEQQRTTILNEELRTASRYKNEFLATMSHELRTPLNSIVGYSELLLQGLYGELTERQEDRISKILRNGRDLLYLINDILDISKIDAGQMILTMKNLDLAGIIDTVIAEKRPAIEKKHLALHSHVTADIPAVYGDQLRIHQVLANLLDNAIKFTPQGDITLTAYEATVRNGTCSQVALPMTGWLKDGRWVIFSVQDTGIGIAPEDHARIFDEFRQVDGTSTRQFGGTGLGLAITKKLVDMHQGSIWVKSRQNEGSIFYVALPASSEAKPGEEPSPEPEATTIKQGTGPVPTAHVLCIDDNQEALDILTTYLSEAGYRVAQATSGRAGVEMARALHPDLITTDLMMPGMTGWDVVNRLKARPETANIPVVIISIVDQQPAGYEPEVTAHIHKPIDRYELLSTVSSIMQSRAEQLPVLVVDDDPHARQLITTLLSSIGHKVVTCTNGTEALKWLEKHRPRLMLLDLMMPELTGFEVLTEIRNRPELANLPVLVVTARPLTADENAQLLQHQARVMRKQGLRKDNLLKEFEDLMAQP